MNKHLFKCIAIICLLFVNSIIAQDEDKITVMSEITCECINNISDKTWENNPEEEVEDCFSAAVLGGLLSMIPTDSDKKIDSLVVTLGSNEVKNGDSVIDNIDTDDLELTKKQLRENCERYNAFEKDNLKKHSERIKAISDEACNCISEIDVNTTKEEKSNKIASCITTSNAAYQGKESILETLEKVKDTLSKMDRVSKTDTLTIIEGGKDVVIVDQFNEEIEEYLYNNCSVMKHIYFTNNEELDNSYSDRKKAMVFYEEGQVAFSKEEYAKAIALFTRAVKKDKKFAFAWDNLGYSYRKLENYNKAIECYKKSLDLDPKGKMPLMNIAVAHQLNNDLDNAKKYYEIYAEYYNDDPEAYYGLGRIYLFQENMEPALDNMIQAYILYSKMKSPYKADAEQHIAIIYKKLEEQDNLELFNKISKKHKLEVNTEE